MSSLLLKGGVALIHDSDEKIQPKNVDILINGNRIAQIGPSLTAPTGCEVIDCTDKIISPGFVDTHHHLWQAPLKGQFGDEAFMPYMATINVGPFMFNAPDMFWCNLAGAMEAIDAGITTVLDHSHANYTKEHSQQAIAGSLTSGLRSVFAYTATPTMTEAKPQPKFADFIPDWFIPVLEKLSKSRALSEGDRRMQLGLGFDGWFLPKDVVLDLFNRAKSLGVKVTTSHYVRPLGEKSPRLPAMLSEYGLLGRGMVASHGGGATVEDVQLLKESGAYFSSTPNSELSMAVGPPVVFRDDLPGADSVSSFGIDCSSITSSSLVNEMRVGLQHARGLDSAAHHKRGELQKGIYHTTHEAFNIGTLGGARALCMEDEIGSIEVGKKADLVMFSTYSPAMIGVSQQDPVMAIVMHSSIGDVEDVIIDGVVRKRDGKLLPVEATEWDEKSGEFVPGDKAEITWRQVASKVLEIQQRFVTELPKFDLVQIRKTLEAMFGFA